MDRLIFGLTILYDRIMNLDLIKLDLSQDKNTKPYMSRA